MNLSLKKLLTFLTWSAFPFFIFAQNNTSSIPENYFQQEVNYDIEVTLDDVNHTLSGVANIEYINHSPDDLEQIYFHLWANAHKNKHTAFAKQEVQLGNRKFYFSKEEDKGGYTKIDFQSNGKTMNWSYDKKDIDIVLIQLNEKLSPNQSLQIRIPFEIKIPRYFSRMGHFYQEYFMAQWYPKPAVYDQEGWHPMAYLSMEEFYSEFGKYDVEITLPENYVVAATGQLQTESEKIFLEKKIKETNEFIANKFPEGVDRSKRIIEEKSPFPPSSNKMKTIRFIAENVHDFAWFTDKRFLVQKSQVKVGKNNKVDTWAFFNHFECHLWLEATKYLNQAIQHYSEEVGAYPYPHATAVSNPFANAGAMEYPMVTLIDNAYRAKDLDMFVAHEVGHNWFYGILAFNERDYPWLDEGINTYYEEKYAEKYYPENQGSNSQLPNLLRTKGELDAEELVSVSMQRENLHQAISTPKHEWTDMNYNIGTYAKTARILKSSINPEKMKSFFQLWKFKHPQPKDFIQHFELEQDDLFNDLMNTTKKVDYKIASISKSDGYKLKIKNKNGAAFPFQLFMISGDKEMVKEVEGFEGTKIIHIPKPDEPIDKFIIDKSRQIPDIQRNNNNIRTSGIFKKIEPIKLKFLAGLENPTRTTISWLPAMGWNNYDKTMLGVLFHNNDLGVRKIDFAIAPMYAFASKQLVGTGQVKVNLFPVLSPFQRITFSANTKRYHSNYNWEKLFYDDYTKFAPQVEFAFKKKKMNSSIHHRVAFRNVNMFFNNGFTKNENPDIVQRKKTKYYVNEIKYTFENSKITGPFEATLTAHQGKDFLKIFANARKFFPFRKSGKGVTLKGFAGILPKLESSAEVAGVFSLSGVTSKTIHLDYMFDEALFGRTEGSDGDVFSQQIFNRDASFKTLSDGVTSQNWMVSLGVSSTLPWNKIPIRPYIDVAVFGKDELKNDKTKFACSMGLALVGISDVFEIYIPIYENKIVTGGSVYDDRKKFFSRISFLLDFNHLRKRGRDMVKFY